jgi:hypothetical protein
MKILNIDSFIHNQKFMYIIYTNQGNYQFQTDYHEKKMNVYKFILGRISEEIDIVDFYDILSCSESDDVNVCLYINSLMKLIKTRNLDKFRENIINKLI